MSDVDFQLEPDGAGALAVRGKLTFDNAHAALLALRERLRGAPVSELDLGGVERSDSAGLSCVLAVLADSRLQGRPLRVRHMPAGMQALARVCEVESLLTAG
ncbi:STAS domain-containing protein [Dyella sp.]|uniref:STAS domain-containing protein n=1 Tax=Dyella sp. TaxID=1869338 RepID=UPI002D76F25F|nr:STAS domain-containing protein [Dyella sp.]HET6431203.1 STAS domain-containing protein [Dyella sp.]